MALKLCGSSILYVIAVLCLYPRISWSFFTSIEPYEEQCYHENVKKGQVWGFLYEVSEGGFLDIDAKVSWSLLYWREFRCDLVCAVSQ
jgi:hypothetical protein